jgi:hypothetical protein
MAEKTREEKTLADFSPFERYHSHRLGWTDGVSGKGIRKEFEKDMSVLGALYMAAYMRGGELRQKELKGAADLHGYVPEILRR